MSQAIGAAVASVRVANLLGSLAIMMFLLFGGFLLNRDQVPWYCTWIADLSYFNYAYEALAVSTASLLHSSLIPLNPSISDVPCISSSSVHAYVVGHPVQLIQFSVLIQAFQSLHVGQSSPSTHLIQSSPFHSVITGVKQSASRVVIQCHSFACACTCIHLLMSSLTCADLGRSPHVMRILLHLLLKCCRAA